MNMKILSENNDAILEIILNDSEDPYCGYTIRLEVRSPDGVFSGQNGAVHFSGFNEFLSAFSNIANSREGVAILQLTEECQVRFFRWNQKGDLGCKAIVTKYIYSQDPLRTTPVSISAEFKINSEFVNEIESTFKQMKG